MNKKATILVVDDENGVRSSFNMVLKDDYNVLLAETGNAAIDVFEKNSVDLVLLDVLLPDTDGIVLLEKFKGMDPNSEVVMVTAVNDIQTAVRAIKLGAYEYIIKPFQVDDVLTIIRRALEKSSLVKEVTYLKKELERYHPFEKIVGEDEKMKKIFELISAISDSEGAVLIQGESGTGKELVARAIHNRSHRKDEPFVVINCAAIPPTLMESEIFGHNRGAFTGASQTTVGKLEIANLGTVFLDDVDTLDTGMQAKLLRVIQEKEFERLGGNKIIEVDVRFVAASNKELSDLISEGKFREDLFYRLNVFPIYLPPLRERKDDIPLLLDHFLDIYSKKTGKMPKKFSKRTIDALMRYNWPGNVREVENLVERLCTVTKKQMIHIQDISSLDFRSRRIEGMKLKDAVKAFEQRYIREVLSNVNGSRKKAAEILGVHRNTILEKLGKPSVK
jgi:DNA-binding NtrC family response regulator